MANRLIFKQSLTITTGATGTLLISDAAQTVLSVAKRADLVAHCVQATVYFISGTGPLIVTADGSVPAEATDPGLFGKNEIMDVTTNDDMKLLKMKNVGADSVVVSIHYHGSKELVVA